MSNITVNYLDAFPGSGKTSFVMNRILEALKNNTQAYILYVAPSIELVRSFTKSLKKKISLSIPDAPKDLVVSSAEPYFSFTPTETSRVYIITHEKLILQYKAIRANTFHLIVDEKVLAIRSFYFKYFADFSKKTKHMMMDRNQREEFREAFINYVDRVPIKLKAPVEDGSTFRYIDTETEDKEFYELIHNKLELKDSWLDISLELDRELPAFKTLDYMVKKVIRESTKPYVLMEEQDDEKDTSRYSKVPKVIAVVNFEKIFSKFLSVTCLSFNFEDTLMYHIMAGSPNITLKKYIPSGEETKNQYGVVLARDRIMWNRLLTNTTFYIIDHPEGSSMPKTTAMVERTFYVGKDGKEAFLELAKDRRVGIRHINQFRAFINKSILGFKPMQIRFLQDAYGGKGGCVKDPVTFAIRNSFSQGIDFKPIGQMGFSSHTLIHDYVRTAEILTKKHGGEKLIVACPTKGGILNYGTISELLPGRVEGLNKWKHVQDIGYFRYPNIDSVETRFLKTFAPSYEPQIDLSLEPFLQVIMRGILRSKKVEEECRIYVSDAYLVDRLIELASGTLGLSKDKVISRMKSEGRINYIDSYGIPGQERVDLEKGEYYSTANFAVEKAFRQNLSDIATLCSFYHRKMKRIAKKYRTPELLSLLSQCEKLIAKSREYSKHITGNSCIHNSSNIDIPKEKLEEMERIKVAFEEKLTNIWTQQEEHRKLLHDSSKEFNKVRARVLSSKRLKVRKELVEKHTKEYDRFNNWREELHEKISTTLMRSAKLSINAMGRSVSLAQRSL